MASKAPAVGERIICQKDNVGLFATANRDAEQLKTNTVNERELRGYRKGETIGVVLDDQPVIGADGTTWYLKVLYTLFGFHKTGLFGQGIFLPEEHEAYVRVSDEPDGWIRESWKPADQEREKQQTASAEVTAYFSGLSGVPKPTAVYDKTVGDKTSIWLDFANGYTVEFEAFKKLTPQTKLTNTTRDPTKPALPKDGLTDDKTGNGKGDKSPFFTTTNILIGVGILAVFGILIALTLNRKKR